MPHNVQPDCIANLKSLLAQVPTQRLHAGQVTGDKPGIMAGETPVFRVREGAEGAAYAALIIETINALPQLLKALETPNAEASACAGAVVDENSPLRQQVEAKITQALSLLPGFKATLVGTWAKLIYAAVEPWLAGGREVLSVAPQAAQPSRQQTTGTNQPKQDRLDAVMEFCEYMLKQEDADSRPNEFALEKWVNEWDKSHNAPNHPQPAAQGGDA